FFYFLGAGMVWYSDARLGVAMVVMAGLLAWRHKANIQRLIQGKESRLGAKKKA
ncbi:MAG TPA: glycerol-3-phosphate acyltransferase, partial [Alicycliphilus sp.]|nr:glycerol-3-phosphate acyltransferase [Alicycliphilus sp.]